MQLQLLASTLLLAMAVLPGNAMNQPAARDPSPPKQPSHRPKLGELSNRATFAEFVKKGGVEARKNFFAAQNRRATQVIQANTDAVHRLRNLFANRKNGGQNPEEEKAYNNALVDIHAAAARRVLKDKSIAGLEALEDPRNKQAYEAAITRVARLESISANEAVSSGKLSHQEQGHVLAVVHVLNQAGGNHAEMINLLSRGRLRASHNLLTGAFPFTGTETHHNPNILQADNRHVMFNDDLEVVEEEDVEAAVRSLRLVITGEEGSPRRDPSPRQPSPPRVNVAMSGAPPNRPPPKAPSSLGVPAAGKQLGKTSTHEPFSVDIFNPPISQNPTDFHYDPSQHAFPLQGRWDNRRPAHYDVAHTTTTTSNTNILPPAPGSIRGSQGKLEPESDPQLNDKEIDDEVKAEWGQQRALRDRELQPYDPTPFVGFEGLTFQNSAGFVSRGASPDQVWTAQKAASYLLKAYTIKDLNHTWSVKSDIRITGGLNHGRKLIGRLTGLAAPRAEAVGRYDDDVMRVIGILKYGCYPKSWTVRAKAPLYFHLILSALAPGKVRAVKDGFKEVLADYEESRKPGDKEEKPVRVVPNLCP